MNDVNPKGAAARDKTANKPPGNQDAITALGTLLRTQEAQVLGAMGLFVG